MLNQVGTSAGEDWEVALLQDQECGARNAITGYEGQAFAGIRHSFLASVPPPQFSPAPVVALSHVVNVSPSISPNPCPAETPAAFPTTHVSEKSTCEGAQQDDQQAAIQRRLEQKLSIRKQKASAGNASAVGPAVPALDLPASDGPAPSSQGYAQQEEPEPPKVMEASPPEMAPDLVPPGLRDRRPSLLKAALSLDGTQLVCVITCCLLSMHAVLLCPATIADE